MRMGSKRAGNGLRLGTGSAAWLCVLLIVLVPGGLHAEQLRVGAWNIQDLHHSEGFALRSFGTFPSVRRDAEDFGLLKKYRDSFGGDASPADIVALQEIGTPQALDRLFPNDQYQTIMSERWSGGTRAEGEGDVYTAIAVRRGVGVEVLQTDHLDGLVVFDDEGNPTRAGTAALLEFAGTQFWFVSVHLKSSCSHRRRPDQSTDEDCELLWEQTPGLADWLAERRAEAVPVTVAGDFNRRFRQLEFAGPIWKALNGVGPEDPLTVEWYQAHPLTLTRLCPTRRGDSTQPIDWIMLSADLVPRFIAGSFWERRYTKDDQMAAQGGRGLSDHCPISIDLQF